MTCSAVGNFPSFLRSRNRAGLFLNRRLTWVAECLDRAAALIVDAFDGRTVRAAEAADLSIDGSGRRRDISIVLLVLGVNQVQASLVVRHVLSTTMVLRCPWYYIQQQHYNSVCYGGMYGSRLCILERYLNEGVSVLYYHFS